MAHAAEISDLPHDVLETILAYLPTKEAGRTCILSTNWRHTWKSIPVLVIRYVHTEVVQTIKWVDQIFALREGPIDKFDLSIITSCPYAIRQYLYFHDAFDRWIGYSSRTEIRELRLYLSCCRSYNIPSSIFSCSSLRTLCIENCFIEFPVERQEFKLLHTLELRGIYFSGNNVERLTSCCPMLENLTLDYCCNHGDNPRICAPNLKKIHMIDWYHFFQLRGPTLLHLCIQFDRLDTDRERTFGFPVIDFNNFFNGLPNLEKLELRNKFFYNIDYAELDTGKFLLQNLKELWLDFYYFDEQEVEFISPLFRNAPNLQVLHLEINKSWKYKIFWKSMKAEISLQSIRTMGIDGEFYCRSRRILPFIKFLLDPASKLQKLIFINFKHYCDEAPMVCLKEEVLNLKVRTNAQIIFEETV